MFDAYGKRDAKGVCAQLTAAARKQMAGGNGGGLSSVNRAEATCGSSLSMVFKLTARQGIDVPTGSDTTVQRIARDGRRATVMVVAGDRPSKLHLVEQGDDWLFAAVPGATPQQAR